jgi:hypothetical protein
MTTHSAFPAISISFSPAWWRDHYGMTFEAYAWQNPIARTERDREQRRLLRERFGNVGLGERDPQPRPMVGGEYGDRFMAALWGCEIVYLPDQAPAAIILPDAARRMHTATLPDVEHAPIVQRAFADARLLQERYGHCEAAVNFGGPLNNAVSVFGDEVVAACAGEPVLAQRILRQMGEAVLAVHDQVVCPLNGQTGGPPRGAYGIGNCPVCMLSPRTYRDVVLPVDLWLSRQFNELHLHHCGVFDAYAGVYQPLRPASLDLGPGSDLRVARSAYPNAAISTYIEVGRLRNIHQAGIDSLIADLVERAGLPELFTHIRIADIGPDIPDATIRSLLTIGERLSPSPSGRGPG